MSFQQFKQAGTVFPQNGMSQQHPDGFSSNKAGADHTFAEIDQIGKGKISLRQFIQPVFLIEEHTKQLIKDGFQFLLWYFLTVIRFQHILCL